MPSYEQTRGQQREQYMRAFKKAVENKNVEAAKTAFQQDILPKHENIGDAIMDVYNLLVSPETEINIPHDTRPNLAKLSLIHI